MGAKRELGVQNEAPYLKSAIPITLCCLNLNSAMSLEDMRDFNTAFASGIAIEQHRKIIVPIGFDLNSAIVADRTDADKRYLPD
jgi:hypothetical protein